MCARVCRTLTKNNLFKNFVRAKNVQSITYQLLLLLTNKTSNLDLCMK